MLFTDALFLPFLALVFLGWLPAGTMGRKVVLVAASLLFYACWDVRFLAPLAFVWLVVRFVPPHLVPETASATRRRWLAFGVGSLLATLFLCKYFDFFLDSLRPLWGAASHPGPALRLLLPVGISFYTFQAISYLVDSHRGKMTPSRSLLDTALYVTFFPLLFAGPIEKGARWLPQIARRQNLDTVALREALERMLLGYLLKVGVADPVAPLAGDVFARAASAGSGELLVGLLLYAVQVYTDFAGYSLIARGIARLFGYEVIRNFEQPYFARSFTEFWRRWHISLSTWIWEYLFTPLMSFWLRQVARLNLRTVDSELRLAYPVAVLTTMLLCGLWHGAGWTFVIWGGLHGLFLAGERVILFGNRAVSKWPRIQGPVDAVKALSAGVLVFALVCLTWIFFRAPTVQDAWVYLSRLVTAGGWVVRGRALFALAVGLGVTVAVSAIEYRRRDEWALRWGPGWARGLIYAAVLGLMALLGGAGGKVPFIYFQF